RIASGATLTMTGGTVGAPTVFSLIGNSAGSTESFSGTTLSNPGVSIFKSATTGSGTVSITSSSLTRSGSGAYVTFVGVNTDLGTSGNQLLFTGLAGTSTAPTALPYATVVTAGGATYDAV